MASASTSTRFQSLWRRRRERGEGKRRQEKARREREKHIQTQTQIDTHTQTHRLTHIHAHTHTHMPVCLCSCVGCLTGRQHVSLFQSQPRQLSRCIRLSRPAPFARQEHRPAVSQVCNVRHNDHSLCSRSCAFFLLSFPPSPSLSNPVDDAALQHKIGVSCFLSLAERSSPASWMARWLGLIPRASQSLSRVTTLTSRLLANQALHVTDTQQCVCDV